MDHGAIYPAPTEVVSIKEQLVIITDSSGLSASFPSAEMPQLLGHCLVGWGPSTMAGLFLSCGWVSFSPPGHLCGEVMLSFPPGQKPHQLLCCDATNLDKGLIQENSAPGGLGSLPTQAPSQHGSLRHCSCAVCRQQYGPTHSLPHRVGNTRGRSGVPTSPRGWGRVV